MIENAESINNIIQNKTPEVFELMSRLGKRLFMPRGIIFQSRQSTDHANKYNASIGIAVENIGFDGTREITVENLEPMVLKSFKQYFNGLETNEVFNYAPPSGDLRIRNYWHEKIVQQNPDLNSKSQISTPIITGGLTHALAITSELFLNKNDTVLIADKMWENYNLIFGVKRSAKLKKYPLFKRTLDGFNIKGFKKALNSIKKEKIVILLNFPNNPTGYTPTNVEMEQIKDVLVEAANNGKKIVVFCDDAYYGLFYDDAIYPGSFFSKLAGLHKNIVGVKIDGISKEDYAWGFRIGFITFTDGYMNKEVFEILEQKATASIRSSISCASRIAQSIFARAIASDTYKQEKNVKFEILKSRVAKVQEIVYRKEFKKYWSVYPFNSGYFMCLKIKGVDAESVRTHALFKHGLGTIAFDTDLRVAFSCIEEKNIEKVFRIIAQSIDEIKAGEKFTSVE